MKKKKSNKDLDRIFEEALRIDCREIDGADFWRVEDLIQNELTGVFEEIDDLGISAYISANTYNYKEPTIHGSLQFCVYGGTSYSKLANKLRSMESDFLTITDVWHPDQTVGISFNGVYEDDNTTYIGARYEIKK